MIVVQENILSKPLEEILRYIESDREVNAPDQRPMDIPVYKAAVLALRSIGIKHKYISNYIDCYVEVQCQESESDGKSYDGIYHVEVTTYKKSDPDQLTKLEKSQLLSAVLDVFHSTIPLEDMGIFQLWVYLSNGTDIRTFDDLIQYPGSFVSSAEMISSVKIQPNELPF